MRTKLLMDVSYFAKQYQNQINDQNMKNTNCVDIRHLLQRIKHHLCGLQKKLDLRIRSYK